MAVNKSESRPSVWAVLACAGLRRGIFILLGLVVVSCQPGPPPTPTIPPDLDITVTPTISTATLTVTPIPSLTASPTLLPATPTPYPPTATTRPPATAVVATATPARTAVGIPPTVIPFTPLPTHLVPPTQYISATSVVAAIPAVVPATEEVITYTPVAGVNPLPVPAIRPVDNLPRQLVNTGFDGNFSMQGALEVRVPDGWVAWYREGEIDCSRYLELQTTGDCPSWEEPGLVYRRPEFTVIPGSGRWLDPPRVVGDGQAARFFCTYGICEGGYTQQVQVEPGRWYTLSALAHAWCSQDTSNPYQSQLTTRDDQLNCAVAVGIDPTGGLNPLSQDIIWHEDYIYDTYAPLSTPKIQATGRVMTIYLRGRSLWGLLHNDFHFDQVAFTPQ